MSVKKWGTYVKDYLFYILLHALSASYNCSSFILKYLGSMVLLTPYFMHNCLESQETLTVEEKMTFHSYSVYFSLFLYNYVDNT